MPIRSIRAVDAYKKWADNEFRLWPRRDDPDDRFSHFAGPAFDASFVLEPGQQIFTIGSCFARNIERVLADRGFRIPTLDAASAEDWGGDPQAILNNYIPPAIVPQIRWAFGFDEFDVARHVAEVRPGRFVDLQLSVRAFRPMPIEVVLERREKLNAMYRRLAQSHAVIVTLGYIEAWYDNLSGLYVNAAPLKSLVDAEPERFDLHVLDYNDVLGSLRELTGLLDRVCPADYRMIFTVSPVPLGTTFTSGDVAVANTYSKSVLRAAVEALVAEQPRADYFPSYESVMLSDRKLVWQDDQVHVSSAIVQFNVDRMIGRYVDRGALTPAEVVRRSRELRKAGRRAEALKFVQQEWAGNVDDADLTMELAELHLVTGAGATAEKLLRSFLERREVPTAHLLLARHLNRSGRHEEAAFHAEAAVRQGAGLQASLERIAAYYNLGRFEEGLAILGDNSRRAGKRFVFMDWKARFLERLDQYDEAEALFRRCNSGTEEPLFMLHFAQFLAGRDRPEEALDWLEKCLLLAPHQAEALKLRADLSRSTGASDGLARPGLLEKVGRLPGGAWRTASRTVVNILRRDGDS